MYFLFHSLQFCMLNIVNLKIVFAKIYLLEYQSLF